MRLDSRAGRIVSTVVVPLLAGAALAAFCVLTFAGVNSYRTQGRHDLSVLGSVREGAKGLEGVSGLDHQGSGAKASYEHLVASAAAHEVGAEQQAAHARRLRSEAVTAKSKALALRSSLAQLLDEEANRDRAAMRLAAKANALQKLAKHDVLDKHSMRSAWAAQLRAAQVKRNAFFEDVKRASEDKAKAKMLLNQERKLFEKSFQMVDKEAKAQTKIDRKDQQMALERRKERHIKDREHVVIEEPHQQHQAILHAKEQAQEQAQAHKLPGFPSEGQAQIAEQKADSKAEARLKRPLWGDRKWPSYYDNALTDPGSQKLFIADEPLHPAPRQLERGDDNEAFDHPRPGADTAVRMPENPARMQAMYMVGSTGNTAYSTNPHMGLPPAPQHMLVDKQPTMAPAILRKFEGDVQKMEQPVQALAGRLEQTLASIQARSAHEQALHLYNTDTASWKELSRTAEQERQQRVAAASSQSRDLINTMHSAMEQANNQMKGEMRDTVNTMKGELNNVVDKFKAGGRDEVSGKNRAAIEQTQEREREMEKVMGKYVSHEREENQAMQNEMRDLVEQSQRSKADVVAQAERWKREEEAKYKHEMQAQVQKAEMKVDQARSQAAMALRAAQQDTSMGSRARLRDAQEHEQHALQVLSKAELEEKQQARVFQREAAGEHSQVTALKSELERVENAHAVRQEVLAERKRERERMEQHFETQQREEARKDADLKEQLQDERSIAERAQQAALNREKELAIARVKQQALRAVATERERLQAARDLAHARKIEDLKDKRLAAREAAELRLEKHYHAHNGPSGHAQMVRHAAATARRGRVSLGRGGAAFKSTMQSEVKKELLTYETKLAAHEKLALKKAAVTAAAQAREAQGEKYDVMSEQLLRVENKLWRKEQGKQLAIENVFGSLGAYSKHARNAPHTAPPAAAPAAAAPQAGSPQAPAARVAAVASAVAAPPHVHGPVQAGGMPRPETRQSEAKELAMARALGFSNVQQLTQHQQEVAGGVDLWGQPDAEARSSKTLDLPNPAAVEKLREQEAAAATPHASTHKAFYNSGLSADVDVPVALAASQGNSFL